MNNRRSTNCLPLVKGGSALQNRIEAGDNIREVFVYVGEIRSFNGPPRESDYRIAVLALPAGVSPVAVKWPVKGFEILAFVHGYRELAIQLLVSELFAWGAVRASVITQTNQRFQFHGVYANSEVSK